MANDNADDKVVTDDILNTTSLQQQAAADTDTIVLVATRGRFAGRVFRCQPSLQTSWNIGRGEDNDICLVGDEEVSSHHAQITFDNEQFKLMDLGSTNGTFVTSALVKAVKLKKRRYHTLKVDQLVTLGSSTFKWCYVVPPLRRPSLNSLSPGLIDAVFANEDLFEAISGMLGAWAYLDLGCVCKSFAHDAWAHILKLLQRLQAGSHVTESVAHQLQLKHASMPAKVAHIRAVASSLGLNANGHGLVGTLKLLTQTWPELAGLPRTRQCLPGPSRPRQSTTPPAGRSS